DLEQRGLGQRGFNELPALLHGRQSLRLPGCRELQSDGPMRCTLAKDLSDEGLVREAEHIVEIPRGILRIASRMGATQYSDSTSASMQCAKGIRGMGGLCECSNEQQVGLGEHFPF